MKKPLSNIPDGDSLSARTKVPSVRISPAIYFLFPAALPEYLTGGPRLSMHELLELFIKSDLDDTGSTGDAGEYKRESETVVFASLFLHCWPCCLSH